MKRHLVLILGLLVITPILLLGWLGQRMADDARTQVAARFNAVIDGKLTDIADRITDAIQGIERTLLGATDEFPTHIEGIRKYLRKQTQFNRALIFDAENRLVFPPYSGDKSAAEEAFLARTQGLWEGRALQTSANAEQTAKSSKPRSDYGWHIWYWGGGLNLMFWRRLPDRRTVAIELDRVRLLASVLSALPTTLDETAERMTLIDSNDRILYQWGVFEPADGAAPRRTRGLPDPLNAWTLTWSGPEPVSKGDWAPSEWIALLAVALALAGLALYFYRESARDLHRAAQRVSFVNQVSHELKTPLTNIRMYAELLEGELIDEDLKVERYVGIIVGESQRLSRLIGNILTFARAQRMTLNVKPRLAVVDDIVADVIEQYAPTLRRQGVEPTFVADAPAAVQVDADALGQIVGNLLTNVEKYASEGSWVQIETQQTEASTVVIVRDDGPGIPKTHRGRIFEAFYRVSDALSDGVTGTGIGLGIARDLARLHGGDLTLITTESGACFKVCISTEGSA